MRPPGSAVNEATYAWRNDMVASHSQVDDWFYRGLMVALTTERRALVMLSFAVTHYVVAGCYHRHRTRTRATAVAA